MGMVLDTQTPDGFDALLKRFNGTVVEYQFFSMTGDGSGEYPSIDTLRTVAQHTVERVVDHYWPPDKRPMEASIRAIYRIDTARLAGHTPRLVGWDEFLGAEWSSPEPREIGDRLTYGRAFRFPPYGNHAAKLPRPQQRWWKRFVFGSEPQPFEAEHDDECTRLMVELLELAIGAKIGSDQVMIWEWPTDWARWFDDGHEWWGAACWTIWTKPDRLVGIVASATD